ncbi:MAG: efflux RND transporter permease subunit, partial [Oleiharenicola lentus]
PDVAETNLIGGVRRQLRVQVDPVRLASRSLTLDDLAAALRAANARSQDGALATANRELLIETGGYFRDANDAANLVLGTWQSRPIFLRDVATVTDAPAEPTDYVLFGTPTGAEEAAVTLSIAKRPGANAVSVVRAVRATVDRLRGVLLPADVDVTFTRDYGATASEKSNELLLHMGLAVFGVALLILLFLGWRESLVVLLAIPVTLALTLFLFYLHGYTLNRITLFALIFSIGILVDDAIVVVENIVRHLRLPEARGRSLEAIAVAAVAEVGPP